MQQPKKKKNIGSGNKYISCSVFEDLNSLSMSLTDASSFLPRVWVSALEGVFGDVCMGYVALFRLAVLTDK